MTAVTFVDAPSKAPPSSLILMNSLPIWAQYLAKLIPTYYGKRIFDGITFKGYGLGELLPGLAVIG